MVKTDKIKQKVQDTLSSSHMDVGVAGLVDVIIYILLGAVLFFFQRLVKGAYPETSVLSSITAFFIGLHIGSGLYELVCMIDWHLNFKKSYPHRFSLPLRLLRDKGWVNIMDALETGTQLDVPSRYDGVMESIYEGLFDRNLYSSQLPGTKVPGL